MMSASVSHASTYSDFTGFFQIISTVITVQKKTVLSLEIYAYMLNTKERLYIFIC